MSETCKICAVAFVSRASLNKHVSRKHRLSVKDYTIQHELNGVSPVCLCGCLSEVTWFKGRPRKFIRGHQSRDPEIRCVMIEKGREASCDPEKRAKNSSSIKRLWNEDLAWRAGHLNSLKRARASSPIGRSDFYDDAFRKRSSDSRNAFWSSPSGDVLRAKMKGADFKKKVSTATSAALSDPEIRKQLSDHASTLIESGVTGPNRTNRSSVHNDATGKLEHFHSDWEKAFYFDMKLQDKHVTKNHGIRIAYTLANGESHTYIPDFFDESNRVLYEVKGRMLPVDDLKFAAARAWCEDNGIVFVVVTKKSSQGTSPYHDV